MSEEMKSIAETMKDLNKKYQADSVVFGDDMAQEIESIDTNCYSLNKIFGCGGLPKSRCIEIYGSESSGKTSLALYLVAQIQKKKGRALWIDAEAAWSSEYAKKIGVDTEDLVVSSPMSGEEGLDIVEKMVATGAFAVVVIDSVAALVPQREIDGDISDVTIALQAKMMSRHLRIITSVAAKTKTCIIYINQTRDNLMTFGYGNKVSTPGGKALKFFASVRLEVKIMNKIKPGEDVVGNHLKISATKNKVGPPFRSAEIDLFFARGIDTVGDILDCAVAQKKVDVSGRTHSYKEVKMGTSRDEAKVYLENNPQTLEEIKKLLN